MMLTKLKTKFSSIFKGEKGRFVGDIGVKAVAELVNAICGILIFSIFARALTKSDYAVSNQLITLGTLFAPIILIKINTAYCVFLPGEKDLSKLKSRFFSSMILSIPSCLIVIALLVFNKSMFSNMMFATYEYSKYMGLIAVYYIFVSLNTLTQDFYRALGKIKKSSMLVSTNAVLKVIFFITFMNMQDIFTLQMVLLIYCLTEFIVLSISFFGIMKFFKGTPLKIDFSALKEYYVYSLPLMPYLILSWVNTSIGRFIINHLVDLESSGIYTFNYSLVVRLFIINTIVGYTIFPYISRFWNEGNKERVSAYLTKAFNIGVFFGLPITFGLIAVLPTIVSMLSGGNYPVDKLMIGILCISMMFNMIYSVFSYLIDLSRKSVWFTVILLMTSVLNVALNFLLIPRYQLYGAAITLMITYFVQAIITIYIGIKSTSVQLKISIGYVIRSLFISLIMYFLTSVCYQNSGVLNFTVSVLVGIVTYFGLHFAVSKITHKPII